MKKLRKKFAESIKNRIMFSIILLVTVSVVLIGVTSIWFNYSGTNQILEQTMTETATIAAERIEQELKATTNIVWELGCIARLTNAENTVEEKLAIVDQKVKDYGFFSGNIIDKEGNTYRDNKNISEREYFQKALKGERCISEPLPDVATGEISIMVAAPLWKEGIPNSTVEGVVVLEADSELLSKIVNSIQVSKTGSAYMIDGKGYTIAHKDSDRVLKQENTIEVAKTNKALAPVAKLTERMIRGESGFDIYTFAGEKKFLAFAPIGSTNGWSIGVNARINDFMGGTIISIIILVILLFITLLVTVFISVNLAKGIGNPIKLCTDRLELLAKGDLDAEIPDINSKDETGTLANSTKEVIYSLKSIIGDFARAMREMSNGNFDIAPAVDYPGAYAEMRDNLANFIMNISNTLTKINNASNLVESSAQQISAGAQSLTIGATDQASSIEELQATVTDISSEVDKNAKNAKSANDMARTVGDDIGTSNVQMQTMVNAMTEINESSQEISNIIQAINDIASQTNLLSLNASIEAARAGEAGRGFAVVADQVGKLAFESAEAAKTSTELIAKSLRSVERGTNIANATAENLNNSASKTQELVADIDQISKASGRQADALEQIAQAVEQIASVVEENTAMAEESSASSEEMEAQAQILNNLVAQFKIKK